MGNFGSDYRTNRAGEVILRGTSTRTAPRNPRTLKARTKNREGTLFDHVFVENPPRKTRTLMRNKTERMIYLSQYSGVDKRRKKE